MPEALAQNKPLSDSSYQTKLMVLFVGLVFIAFYVEAMLTPSLPLIAKDFGTTISQVSLVVALYAMSGTALVPVVGKLGDIYGKKRVLVYVLAGYAACVSVTGFSPTFEFLLAARTAQGIGIAIFPLLLGLIREQFPKDRIPRAVGILSGMNGIGVAVAFTLGSFVANDYGWRFTYHTAVPVVIVLAVMSYFLVRESPHTKPTTKIDYAGAILLGASLASVILALGEGASWGWTSTGTLSLIGLGLALLFPLALYEKRYFARGGEPVLNLQLMGMRNVLVTNLVLLGLLALTLAQQAFVFKLELPSPVGYGLDIFQTGLFFVPLALSMVIFAPLTGLIVSRTGVKPLGVLGSLTAAGGFVCAAQVTSLVGMIVSTFVIGAGLAVMMSSIQSLLLLSVESREIGLAAAMNTVFRSLGNSIGAPIAGAVLSTFTVTVVAGQVAGGSPVYEVFPSAAAFQYAFYIGAVVLLGIAAVILSAHEVLGRGRRTAASA